MEKTLVAYFSASGVTAKLARQLADAIGADVFEIRPETPYTDADLNWNNPQSRSSVEMRDQAFRPPVAAQVADMGQYSRVFVGFPIWWYIAPTIINTFLEQHDLSGKRVIPFATSGGSGMGQTNRALAPSCPGAQLLAGKCWRSNASAGELRTWAAQF